MNASDLLLACRDALGSANVQAFLRVIRAGESGQQDAAYRTLFGGALFDSFDDHPRQLVVRGTLRSTAAGAYQFLSRTWDECRAALSLPDFSPPMQDIAAVYLIRRRGALADVLAGRIEDAIAKCAKEWASLPGSPYGQPTRTMPQALAVYAQFGGQLATDAAPAQDNAPSAPPVEPQPPSQQPTEDDIQSGRAFSQPEPTMPLPAIAAALLPSLIESIPKLSKLFGSGSAVAERNVAAAELALQVVQQATGARNAQEAVETIKADPAALKQASQAIDENWFRFEDVREKSVAAAREMYATRDRIVFWNMVFHEVLALVMVCMTAAGMTAAFIGGDLSQSTKDNIVMLGLVGGFISIKEFFFGGSRGSDTKTAIMERRQ